MIVIPERRLVLLLPWTAGSQTLRVRLGALGQSPYPAFYAFNPHVAAVVHQHLNLAQFAAMPEARAGHRLAVFVRNPHDRVASGFMQVQRDIESFPQQPFRERWIAEMVASQLTWHGQRIAAAQGDVNAWFRRLPEQAVRCGGRDATLPLHPCHYWTHDAGRPASAVIGKVESFEEDFRRLCETFDLPPLPKVTANVSTGVARWRDRHGYEHAHRLARDVIGRINRLFADDFRRFGYVPLAGEDIPPPGL